MPLRLADESDDELVNALFRSGKWRITKTCGASQCACVMFRQGMLQLIGMAIGCLSRARAQPKMWEYEVLMWDSGMSGVFAGYSSKKWDGW